MYNVDAHPKVVGEDWKRWVKKKMYKNPWNQLIDNTLLIVKLKLPIDWLENKPHPKNVSQFVWHLVCLTNATTSYKNEKNAEWVNWEKQRKYNLSLALHWRK